MYNPYFLVPRFLPLIFIFSFFLEIGCTPVHVQKTLTAAELLQAGKRQLKLSDAIQAKALFQQVLEDYPDSKERVAALMLLADTHYAEKEYQEAKFHYRRFIELYPANKYVDRAHYYKAMSDFKMMDIALRDQTSTKSALASFELLINNYPKSRYKQRAIERRDRCLNNLAGNIMEIGRYYFRTGSYQSAIVRLQSLAEQYPNHANMDEAVFLIAESYFNSQNFGKARRKYHKLLKEYPQSFYAKEARSRLRKLR
jgi:outer membrane protein assembly factor BamD